MMIKKELELYVHIPFCVRKCAYCDFLSAPADARERTLYVDALTEEIRAKQEEYKNYQVSTIFLGGGTPSILDESEITRIFRALYESFAVSDGAEITMEVNPGTVTEEKAAAWKQYGVNRISIGLQSADDRELQMLGRIHTYRDFLNTWKLVHKAGFRNVNIDLISAIPGQTPESWRRTLRAVAELEPEHISAYSLIVEKGTPFYEWYGKETEFNPVTKNGEAKEACHGSVLFPPLPDEDSEREIYKATEQILAGYGYRRYEISNYAKEGYECRHNLGYWERREYLGLGLGASSLIDESRFHNTEDMKKYLEFYGKPASDPSGHPGGAGCRTDVREEIESLSKEEQMEEYMFLGLRKTEGISVEEFSTVFGRDIFDVYGKQIDKMKGQGLLKVSENRLRLTERGTDVSNHVFSEFMF